MHIYNRCNSSFLLHHNCCYLLDYYIRHHVNNYLQSYSYYIHNHVGQYEEIIDVFFIYGDLYLVQTNGIFKFIQEVTETS